MSNIGEELQFEVIEFLLKIQPPAQAIDGVEVMPGKCQNGCQQNSVGQPSPPPEPPGTQDADCQQQLVFAIVAHASDVQTIVSRRQIAIGNGTQWRELAPTLVVTLKKASVACAAIETITEVGEVERR